MRTCRRGAQEFKGGGTAEAGQPTFLPAGWCPYRPLQSRSVSGSLSLAPSLISQDPADGLCLAGGSFRRCAIDTLWHATGEPGSYQLHKRAVEEGEKELCLDRNNCKAVPSTLDLRDCRRGCAKNWNILGDAETGYVITEGDSESPSKMACLHREGEEAKLVSCEEFYTPLSLNFATSEDIEAMSSPGARLITAASAKDKKAVEKLLKDGIDVNSRDWDGLTPLTAASSEGATDIVKHLLKKVRVSSLDIHLRRGMGSDHNSFGALVV